jgi:ribonuclease HI
MNRDLKILLANTRRTEGTQHSIMNDSEFSEYSLLLITEPYIITNKDNQPKAAPQFHTYWTPILPDTGTEENRPRAMIWTHRNIKTKPVKTADRDIAAVIVETNERTILAISIYVPAKSQPEDPELLEKLNQIRTVIQETRRNTSNQVELVIGGDFNRYDQLWGGDRVALTNRQGEGEPIIQLMADLNLQNMLPRGTTTWQSDNGDYESTIDLMMATPQLAEEVITCTTEGTEHGSDHLAIRTTFSTSVTFKNPPPRKLWKKADWSQINKAIEKAMEGKPQPEDPEDVDSYWKYIRNLVTPALDRYAPRAKPSPYAKRWWTEELSQLRKDYTYWRNRARSARRSGTRNPNLETMSKEHKQRFYNTMRQQRKTHWQDFIADAKNIWKVSRYLDPTKGTAFSHIPSLQLRNQSVSTEPEIAEALLGEFFKPLPQTTTPLEDTAAEVQQEPLPMEEITEAEVHRAILSASPYKAPGMDDIPVIVWQKTWSSIKHHITALFQLSIRTNAIPKEWKVARIIPLRKPAKPDYTVAKAYRPISLLATLGKILEALVAERLSYLVETHNLLPKNHFGARKGRSATQALTIIQEHVYQAWRDKKVMSMVSFDLKGAYNGVNIEALEKRLRKRRIPEVMINWIINFCRQRKASVVVNGHTTTMVELSQAGLPQGVKNVILQVYLLTYELLGTYIHVDCLCLHRQTRHRLHHGVFAYRHVRHLVTGCSETTQGSPLSPILFLFFNADLISSKLNRNRGAVAFVDDYTAWVTGLSAEVNTEIIQETIIPNATKWANTSGATFEADKTAFIHFTRNPNKLSDKKLNMDGKEISPELEIKVLGVILDQGLKFKQHAARVTKRGIKAALALRRIRGMTPKTTRQLFKATVSPVVDYASPVWSTTLNQNSHQMLNQVQRIGAQAIVGAFRTVALERVEMEASLVPTKQRLEEQQNKFWVKSHTLPDKHPLWRIHRAIDVRNRRFVSPLQRIASRLETIDLSELEIIEPFCIPPWQEKINVTISSREEALKWAEESKEIKVFVDASYRKGRAGIGLFHAPNTTVQPHQESIQVGYCEGYTATHIETLAIERAIKFVSQLWYPRIIELLSQDIPKMTYVIVSDSQAAIRQIANPRHQSGQAIVRNIYKLKKDMRERGAPEVRLQWIPAHASVIGDEIADKLAKEATEGVLTRIDKLLIPSALKRTRKLQQPTDSNPKYAVDSALPGRHTETLYDNRPYKEAAVLCQLRTGKSRLNHYLAKIRAVETDQCECPGNPSETTRHFLFECPRWCQHRKTLREAVGDRWGDLTFVLGGRSEQARTNGELLDGPRKYWKPDTEVVDRTIEFALKTGRLT